MGVGCLVMFVLVLCWLLCVVGDLWWCYLFVVCLCLWFVV